MPLIKRNPASGLLARRGLSTPTTHKRQPDDEFRSDAHNACDADGAAVQLNQILGSGQPKPGAREFRGYVARALISFEHMREVRGRDAHALVLHRQHCPAPVPSYLHGDVAASGAVLDGVSDDVVEYALESLWVPLADGSGLGPVEPKGVILRGLLVVRDYQLCKVREVRRASS
jgi:hypothetical protein